MPKSDEHSSSLDIKYMRRLFEDLAASNKEQAKVIGDLGRNVGETTIILKSMNEKQEEHTKKLDKYEERIRTVERTQDSCNASGQIRAVWAQIRSLNAFKDAVLDRSREDSQVFDIQSIERQPGVAEATLKASAIRMLPWFIVVFVVGVVLATTIVFQAFSGKQIIDISALQKAATVKVDE